jgi:hypothetical protein
MKRAEKQEFDLRPPEQLVAVAALSPPSDKVTHQKSVGSTHKNGLTKTRQFSTLIGQHIRNLLDP